MTQAFVYHWQELSTNKWYIGSRIRKGCHPNDGYICSSKIVRPLIKATPSNWKRTIIAVGEPNDMLNFEITLLKLLNAKNDLQSYNLHNQDKKFSYAGKKHSKKVRQKISAKAKNRIFDEKTKQKISLTMKKRRAERFWSTGQDSRKGK